MILDISESEFRYLFNNENFFLPIRWDNIDFFETLKQLFDTYKKEVLNLCINYNLKNNLYRDVEHICDYILDIVKHYLKGFPGTAFNKFKNLMIILQKTPLKVYQKTIMEQFYNYESGDPLKLYRIVCVNDNIPYNRSRVFHAPYNLRSKVSTSRYSIAGYPSLYLGTSLELCEEEVKYNPHEQYALASRFQLERYYEKNNIYINVIELGLKPQDFLEESHEFTYDENKSRFSWDILQNNSIRHSYIYWYPLIASCSFIRVNKKDPFAAEYIIPQLLMQWARREMKSKKDNNSVLVGIRYFSCASIRASKMGYNYVFPTSGQKNKSQYCPVLSKAFKLTKPKYIHEYNDIKSCEKELLNDTNLDFI